MLIAAITALDYAVLGLYLVLLIGIGAYFSRQQHDSRDFFLAGRSMGWFPVGLSVMATLLSALSYTGVPAESYKVGLRFLLYGVSIWLTLPVMLGLVVPIFHRLRMYSIYEYLEYRFDLAVRMAGSGVFIIWRLLWLGGVLYAPCKVVVVAVGLSDSQQALLMITLGAISTFYTYLGGMKAVIWTDVLQSFVMMAGLIAIIGTIWANLDGGPGRVWKVNETLQRIEPLPATTSANASLEESTAHPSFWSQKWLVWSMVPHMFFAFLSFYVADQITAQRFLTARSLKEVKRSYLLNCVSVTLMMSVLMYVGMALLAFYHDHPQEMKPYWVVSTAEDEPQLTRTTDFQKELPALIEAGAILHPNTGEPITSVEEVTDPATGEPLIDRLAERDPRTGERRVKRGFDELMPRFIVRHLLNGLAGLIFAALLAASMSSMDSGLNSITTLLVSDFYRRLGVGREFLAGLRGKAETQLDETDELWMGRWLVLVIGVAATAFSLFVSRLGNIFDIMIEVCNTFGAPLLAVFLLGMLSRRVTAPAALSAMLLGMPLTIWLAFGDKWGLWPWETPLASVWAVTFGTLGTMALGYALSFLLGSPREREALEGLVLGIGTLGERPEPPDVADDEGDARWR